MKNLFIKTFGCQQNINDSERLAKFYIDKGYKIVNSAKEANLVIINTCMVRESSEEKIYGYAKKIKKEHKNDLDFKIIVTGCLVGVAQRSSYFKERMKKRLPFVDEFLPISKINFNAESLPLNNKKRLTNKKHAWVTISNGCNNFCSFCIVPFARGKEISKEFNKIIKEVKNLLEAGYKEITLLGQNVNSYGSDIIKKDNNFILPNGKNVKPIMVDNMGKKRIPTLFPYLLEEICKFPGITNLSFVSANPWDFSDKLIETIQKNPKIDRTIHLPLQAGDDNILKRMNRNYTQKDYLNLIEKIKKNIPNVKFTTDIIVGFPGETDKAFNETVKVCKEVNFIRGFIARYSPRKGTLSEKKYKDDVPQKKKRERLAILNKLTNKKLPQDLYIPFLN